MSQLSFASLDYQAKRKRTKRERQASTGAMKDKRKPGRQLSRSQRKRNRKHGAVGAKVEHVFRVVTCQFGYRKLRYRGIPKNGAQVFT